MSDFKPHAVEAALRTIREEEVAADAPRWRYIMVERLELLWRACHPHIEPPMDADGIPLYRPDPRYLEAGIRVLDRLAKIYRLNEAGTGTDPVVSGKLSHAVLVGNALKELEAKIAEAAE